VLQGVQPNIFKCFLPITWRNGRRDGVSALLHPEGVYDDPNGGVLRRGIYQRLSSHYQFVNEKSFSQSPIITSRLALMCIEPIK